MGDKDRHVRPAVLSDVPALAAVHLAAWVAAYRGILADSHLDTLTAATFEGYHRPRLVQPEPACIFLAMDVPGTGIAGFARAGPTRPKSPTGDALPDGFAELWAAELYAIYLQPRYQGRGLGRALFHSAVSDLGALGYSSLCVWVLSENKPACGFYERMGGEAGVHAPLTLAGATHDQVSYTWSAMDAAIVASG